MPLEKPALTPRPTSPVLVHRSGSVPWMGVLGVAAASLLIRCGGTDVSSDSMTQGSGGQGLIPPMQPPMQSVTGGARNTGGASLGSGGQLLAAPMVPPMPPPMVAPMEAPAGGSSSSAGGNAAQAGSAGLNGSGGDSVGEVGGAIPPMPPPMPAPAD